MSISQVVDAASKETGISNPFDALVAIRDEAQRQISELRDSEYESTKQELAELQKQLAGKKLRLDSLDTVAITAKRKRSDAGKPREKKVAAK